LARPTKSARVLSDCSQTKDEINARIENEEKLKGKSEVHPTQQLTESQLVIFNFVKDELEESKLLSGLDSFLLTLFSITADRLQFIEDKINKKPSLAFNKDLISSKKAYTADFLRCCNELSLSPQSRAKLANINVTAKTNKEDAALSILRKKKHGHKRE